MYVGLVRSVHVGHHRNGVRQIDENTLERVADLVCDTDGPNHRQAWELPRFLRKAGWAGVPEYDESGRRRWVLAQLLSRRSDQAAIEQVLCRLADPLEYDEPRQAQRVAQELNRFLALEGLKVTYAGGRPHVVALPAAMIAPDAPAPVHLQRELGSFIQDPRLAAILRQRLDEVHTCREHGACLATIILLGSILEGALLDVATRFVEAAMRSSRAPADGRKVNRWSLSELIDVGHERGWIQSDVQRFSHVLRDYRNFVHPREQQKRDEFPDQDTVSVCWDVVIAALNDLGAAVAAAHVQGGGRPRPDDSVPGPSSDRS